MLPNPKDNYRANGKVHVIDGDNQKPVGFVAQEELKETNVPIVNNDHSVKSTPTIVENGFDCQLKIKANGVNGHLPSKPTQSQQIKLKTFEIYKFADKLDILLMILGGAAALATGATFPLMMWLFQDVINGLIDAGKQQTGVTNVTLTSDQCYVPSSSSDDPYTIVNEIIKWYIVSGFASIILYWFAYATWMIAAERQLRRIRYTLFGNILRQEMGWFDCRNAGELSGRLIDDLENIRDGIGFYVGDCICLLSRIIASVIFSLYTGWKMTLVFLSISPLIILSYRLLIRVIVKYTILEMKAYSVANAIAQEVLGAIRIVTAFSGQNKEVDRYRSNLLRGKRVAMQKGLMLGLTQSVINLVLYGGIAIIFWYGPYLARTECLIYTPGRMIDVILCGLMTTFSIVNLFPNIQAFAGASSSSGYVFEIIKRQSKIDAFLDDGEIPSTFVGDIEFKNVHFTYPARKNAPILNDLSMLISSGKTVALCGSSGAGKSTAIHLIQRLYDPDQGQILLDGRDIRSLNLKWLRSNIGIVSQEPVLFFGSIEDNIRFGKSNATDEEVIAAAKLANAHDFIMQLPDNYKTSSGDKLSGGQKQRIAIARALISNPKILLLDEATSALDNRSEKRVQDALEKAKEGRTTIIIAHRLSTIQNADLIVGLESGHVVERGTHNQLMQENGLYYELVTSQSVKQEESDSDKDDEMKIPLLKTNSLVQTKNTQRHSRRMSKNILARHSIISSKSVVSQTSNETGDELSATDESRKTTLCRLPFMIQVLRLNSPEWFYIVIGGIGSLVYGAVMPTYALVFSQIYGVLVEPDLAKQEDEIRMYTYIVFLIGVAGAISQFASTLALTKAGEELTMRMRLLSFSSIIRQEIGWFDQDENNTGALATRLSSDASALKGFTGATLSAFLNAVGALIAALGIAFSAGWKLTFVVLCFTPIIVLTGVMQGQQAARIGRKKSPSNTEEGGKHATQAIENIRTVVSLHQEKHFIELYENAFNREFRSRMFTLHLMALGNSLANSVMFFIHAAAFGYGSVLVQNKEMEFHDVFKVFIVVTYSAMFFGRSASMVPNYSKGKASALRILELNQRQSQIDPDNSSGLVLSEVRGEIEFRDVNFQYPARPKLRVLRHFNLTCKSGATTALVGPSGDGKSTSVALLERFYDPVEGSIHLDGHDIRSLNIRWLRSLFGLVQQEPVLFDLSIRDNIAYGDNARQVSQIDIELAAKKANIHDLIISLPKGYETSCGAKGGRLSGGEKQRVAIARVLLRAPKILLLDEATSALDNKNERMVQSALDKARFDRTCLTIAHRLSTIKNANEIAVLDQGRIKESGQHDELIRQHGLYYKLNKVPEHSENAMNQI